MVNFDCLGSSDLGFLLFFRPQRPSLRLYAERAERGESPATLFFFLRFSVLSDGSLQLLSRRLRTLRLLSSSTMPSRQQPQPQPLYARSHHLPRFLLPAAAASAAFAFLIFLLAFLLWKLFRRRAATGVPSQPRRFSYRVLEIATSSFSASNKLGQGGFGSVYRATVPDFDRPLALKVMDSGSLQGEREFHNELALATRVSGCHSVVSPIGYSSCRRGDRLLLVYELMPNGSLQDSLLEARRPELMRWGRRFSVALDVAKGLLFLHCSCDPPIIHGDIKPSNILLDHDFSAKIADFGLARIKVADLAIGVQSPEVEKQSRHQPPMHPSQGSEDGSMVEETDSATTMTTTTVFEDGNIGNEIPAAGQSRSPEQASCSEAAERAGASEGKLDRAGAEEALEDSGTRKGKSRRRPGAGSSSDFSNVKEYVMEWIGREIKERPKSSWLYSEGTGRSPNFSNPLTKKRKTKLMKKQTRRLEWWTSLDDEKDGKKENSGQARVWWREEFCDELSKKTKRRKAEEMWQKEEASIPENCPRNQSKRKSRSHSSIDWWMDGISGEFRFSRRCNLGGASGGVSSTPSMRGTVCYVAPESGGGGPPSEKCDVYSYGVLLLVIIAGRRPLQVSGSPVPDFERANLISWARQLAGRGKLLDLVDPAIEGLDQEQALRCVTVALLCLQRSPLQRPCIKQVVGMLSGQTEPPHLPVEFSPSPPSSFPFKTRKRAR